MIIHLLGRSMYTADTYQLLSSAFPADENVFACLGKSKMLPSFPPLPGTSIEQGSSCQVVSFLDLKFWRLLCRCDGFIVHGFFKFSKVLILILMPWMVKKSNWVVWGGDLYVHNDKKRSLSGRLSEWTRLWLCPKFRFITTVADGDYALAQLWYNVKGRHLSISYPLPLHKAGLLERLMTDEIKPKSPINIMIGNSASDTNQHFEALNILSKYKDEDIRIHLPLNYGPGDFHAYADRVERHAKEIFGESKVVTLREKLSGDEFTTLARQMHVGVFNNNRQQAMGTINILIACGAKLYLRDDTTMWAQYRQRGLQLHVCLSIPNESFAEFIYEPEKEKQQNLLTMSAHLDRDGLIHKWRIVLDAMKGISQNPNET